MQILVINSVLHKCVMPNTFVDNKPINSVVWAHHFVHMSSGCRFSLQMLQLQILKKYFNNKNILQFSTVVGSNQCWKYKRLVFLWRFETITKKKKKIIKYYTIFLILLPHLCAKRAYSIQQLRAALVLRNQIQIQICTAINTNHWRTNLFD